MPITADIVSTETCKASFLSQCDIIDDDDSCWNWNGQMQNRGYGWFKVLIGNKHHKVLAHRISWFYATGVFLSDRKVFVLHRCDNRRCVRHSHHFLGDAKANMHDAMAKGRSLKGETVGTAILSEADVRAIRADLRSCNVVSKAYGVSRSAITGIRRRVFWKHVA